MKAGHWVAVWMLAAMCPIAAAQALPPPREMPGIAAIPSPFGVAFTPESTEHRFAFAELGAMARNLPPDWSDYNFLVIEWRPNSSQRFQLELITRDGEGGREVMVAKRIDPFQNAWVRVSIPLEFFRKPARE